MRTAVMSARYPDAISGLVLRFGVVGAPSEVGVAAVTGVPWGVLVHSAFVLSSVEQPVSTPSVSTAAVVAPIHVRRLGVILAA
ncbi:hypothetical protein [Nocardia mangyaensis]|uniref:hypothetical protein n=1 Tax=Nocardia mangyaensis TaxID=2213200 RepID=UPI001F0AC41E|nr:hypothetical protein [Nocardia mangyaensis]